MNGKVPLPLFYRGKKSGAKKPPGAFDCPRTPNALLFRKVGKTFRGHSIQTNYFLSHFGYLLFAKFWSRFLKSEALRWHDALLVLNSPYGSWRSLRSAESRAVKRTLALCHTAKENKENQSCNLISAILKKLKNILI